MLQKKIVKECSYTNHEKHKAVKYNIVTGIYEFSKSIIFTQKVMDSFRIKKKKRGSVFSDSARTNFIILFFHHSRRRAADRQV